MRGMSWRDRIITKVMGNKLVVKLLSMPVVLKVLMWETQAFMSAIALFERRGEAAD